MKKKDKVRYYHVIPGDTRSRKVYLTTEELYDIEKNLSATVAYNYQNDIHDAQAQKDAHKLICVSISQLGGQPPMRRQTKTGPLIPVKYRSNYISHLMYRMTKNLMSFKREKGAWTDYVKFSAMDAVHETIKDINRDNKEWRLQQAVSDRMDDYYRNLGNIIYEST